jgi:hypothetical protein
MMNTKVSIVSAVLLAYGVCAAPASATTLSFECITGNLAGDCAIGEAQLTVDVTFHEGVHVLFEFKNSGPLAASITDVYFDDGTLLSINSIINGTGVDFSEGADPGNLPGGNTLNPAFDATFSADSNPPVPQNGVNPGETLGVLFNLQPGGTFADVIGELADGTLRVGIHVQAFDSGGSESFVNGPVPVPAAIWLLGSGLLGLIGIAKRRRD